MRGVGFEEMAGKGLVRVCFLKDRATKGVHKGRFLEACTF